MANYDDATISASITQIRRITGLDVLYSSGTWSMVVNGQTKPVSAANAATFDMIAADVAVSIAAKRAATQAQGQASGPSGAGSGSGGSGSGSGSGDTSGSGSAWWQRMTSTPSARATLRPLRRYVGAGAALGTLSNIHESGSGPEHGAEAIVQGAGSVASNAFQAGAKIGQTLLDGALQPFGASGAAVSRFAGQIAQTVQGALGTGIGALGRVAGMIGKVAGTGIGVATAGVGAVAGGALGMAVGSAPGFLIGAAIGSLAGVAIGKITAAFGDMVGSVLGAVGHALGAIGELASGALKTVLDVLSDITQSTMALSRAALDLSQKSGLSLASAASANNLLAGFGLKGSDVEGLSRNTIIGGAYSRLLGLQGEQGSESWLRSFRAQYMNEAQTPQGLPSAQVKAQAAGLSALIPMANMNDRTFNRQIERSNSIQNSLGMSPQQMAQAGQDMASLSASVAQFVEVFKAKVGSELLPFLTSSLDRAIGWVSAHAGEISTAIQKGASFLVNDLPPLVLHGFAAVLRGGAWFAGAMENGARSLAGHIRPILGFFDAIINAVRRMVAFGAGISAGAGAVGRGAQAIGQDAARAWRGPSGVATAGMIGEPLSVLAPLAGPLVNKTFGNPLAAFSAAQNSALAGMPESHLADTYGARMENFFNARARDAHGGQEWLEGRANQIDSYANGFGRSGAPSAQPPHAPQSQAQVLAEAIRVALEGMHLQGGFEHRYVGHDKFKTETTQFILTGMRLARSRS